MTDTSGSTDHESLDRAKSVLRLKARAARRSVLPELRTAYAYAVAERVLALPEIAGASAVMVYGASPEEVDVSVLEFALRERGTRIAYPRVAGPRELTLHWVDRESPLVNGAFDLREPTEDSPRAPLEALSALIVPGVAFDPSGNRLGFGGGYYDSLLADVGGCPLTIGVAYDEQVVDRVPHDSYDRPMDIVVTPTRTYRIGELTYLPSTE
ncbi:MAG: 5-formyltetrahydrofolate cyclo-ligase [Coriobacteriia bacterium]|nr:5-formyltetrahydrofolate cyclo-ligase [Coriobacteriia bacterium]MBN2839434.1 5-formyltetrahydrofolate cyclo-ligase [Coriobacteriia bacterium]